MSADAWNIILGGIAGAALTAAVAVFLYFRQRRDTNKQIEGAKKEAVAAERRSEERTMATEERTKKAGDEGEKRARLAAFHEACHSAKTWLEWLSQERENLGRHAVRPPVGRRLTADAAKPARSGRVPTT